jgi:hypothetical protein
MSAADIGRAVPIISPSPAMPTANPAGDAQGRRLGPQSSSLSFDALKTPVDAPSSDMIGEPDIPSRIGSAAPQGRAVPGRIPMLSK